MSISIVGSAFDWGRRNVLSCRDRSWTIAALSNEICSDLSNFRVLAAANVVVANEAILRSIAAMDDVVARGELISGKNAGDGSEVRGGGVGLRCLNCVDSARRSLDGGSVGCGLTGR